MPVRGTGESHRALERLEDYHASLVSSGSSELKREISSLISHFKSALFQSLIEIQELYEETLLDEGKSTIEKTYETKRLAERWEKNPPFGRSLRQKPIATSGSVNVYTDQPGSSSQTNGNASLSYSTIERRRQFSEEGRRTNQTNTPTTPSKYVTSTTSSGLVDNESLEWELEEVVLEKGHTGLGFSIAGGVDQPYIDGDSSIYVTNIIPGGAASADGRMRAMDIITRVNSTNCNDVTHDVIVDALKYAANVVRLVLKRRRLASHKSPSPYVKRVLQDASMRMSSLLPPTPSSASPQRPARLFENIPGVNTIDLYKGTKGLGFSIAGGVGNEHVQGDTGIYVTRIIDGGAAYHDGRLGVGDKLLSVDAVTLDNVTHEYAVDTLKHTATKVTLRYVSNPHPELLPPTLSRSQSLDANAVALAFSRASLQEELIKSVPQRAPHDVSPQEVSMHPRGVSLNKGMQGLGFNIVGGEEGEPIFISYVLPGGVADLSGAVRKGDVLLQVNSANLRRASHSQAAAALKEATNPIELTLQFRPQEYAEFETKIDQLRRGVMTGGAAGFGGPKKDIFVRSLFDFEPSRDAGVPQRVLSFFYGDILHVTSTVDDDWWTARLVTENGEEGSEGVIPSKRRVEKKERQHRKQVNFNAGSQSAGRLGMETRRGSRSQLSFSRKFPFVKSTERLNELADNELGLNEETIPTYVAVERKQINYSRPVIILGALKDLINDELFHRDPDRFSGCVPHTSRLPKMNEVDGKDYHFVSKEQMQEDVKNNLFIEAGQFQDNLYGTSINSVREVSDAGRHCILDVSGNAIRRLQSTASIYPIAIFVKPHNHHQIMDWDHSIDEDDAYNQYERCQRIDQNFGDLFTAVVDGESFEELVRRVMRVISDQSTPTAWVPCKVQVF